MTSFCIDYYQDSGEGISVHNSQAEALLQNFTPFLLDPKVSPVEVIHVGNLFFFFLLSYSRLLQTTVQTQTQISSNTKAAHQNFSVLIFYLEKILNLQKSCKHKRCMKNAPCPMPIVTFCYYIVRNVMAFNS